MVMESKWNKIRNIQTHQLNNKQKYHLMMNNYLNDKKFINIFLYNFNLEIILIFLAELAIATVYLINYIILLFI